MHVLDAHVAAAGLATLAKRDVAFCDAMAGAALKQLLEFNAQAPDESVCPIKLLKSYHVFSMFPSQKALVKSKHHLSDCFTAW